jgi:O-antigen/teichoic acid export membrane protein
MAAQILIFGLFFYAIAGMAGNMLLTINKQIARLGILLASALLNFVFSYAALQLGYGIAGVAVGTSLSYFVFFLTSIVAAMRYTRASYVEIGRLLLKILSPIFCIGSVIASYIILMPVPSGALGSLIKRTAIGEAVLIMLSFYFVRRVYRSGLISAIFRR